jgi:hypothetical protein
VADKTVNPARRTPLLIWTSSSAHLSRANSRWPTCQSLCRSDFTSGDRASSSDVAARSLSVSLTVLHIHTNDVLRITLPSPCSRSCQISGIAWSPLFVIHSNRFEADRWQLVLPTAPYIYIMPDAVLDLLLSYGFTHTIVRDSLHNPPGTFHSYK